MKWYGEIGFSSTEETTPGVWTGEVTRNYYGDVIRNARRLENGSGLNDNFVVNNSISIVADPYAMHNFQNMLYISWMGNKWKISNVEVKFPRLELTLGGEYNG